MSFAHFLSHFPIQYKVTGEKHSIPYRPLDLSGFEHYWTHLGGCGRTSWLTQAQFVGQSHLALSLSAHPDRGWVKTCSCESWHLLVNLQTLSHSDTLNEGSDLVFFFFFFWLFTPAKYPVTFKNRVRFLSDSIGCAFVSSSASVWYNPSLFIYLARLLARSCPPAMASKSF